MWFDLNWSKHQRTGKLSRASRVALVGTNPPANAGDTETQVRSLGRDDLLEKLMQPAVFLPGKFHAQRSLHATVHGAAKSQTWLSTNTQETITDIWIINDLLI